MSTAADQADLRHVIANYYAPVRRADRLRVFAPPAARPRSVTCWRMVTRGLRGVRGGRSLPMRQAMTLTFSAWGPFWPCVMSNSTFCPSSRLR